MKLNVKLSEDMKKTSDYCMKNELIINTKKGKTEAMLFGSAKRLKNAGKKIVVICANTPFPNYLRC